MRIGNKKIYHLEAWVVKVMSLYKVCPCLSGPYGPLTRWSFQHFFHNIDMSDFDWRIYGLPDPSSFNLTEVIAVLVTTSATAVLFQIPDEFQMIYLKVMTLVLAIVPFEGRRVCSHLSNPLKTVCLEILLKIQHAKRVALVTSQSKCDQYEWSFECIYLKMICERHWACGTVNLIDTRPVRE